MTARRVVLVVSGVILAALLVLPLWLSCAELPNPLATRWDLRGVPQGSMSASAFGLLMGVLALPGAVAVAWAGVKRDLPKTARSSLAGLGGAHAALFALIVAETTHGQRGVAHWRDALGPDAWDIALFLGLSALVGAALASVGLGLPGQAAAGEGAALGALPTLGLGPEEQAVWVRRVSGVRLELSRGRVLVVTVDDAETAAGLLNDLLAREDAAQNLTPSFR